MDFAPIIGCVLILFVSFPLAILAGATTTLAIVTLCVRASFVYATFAIHLLRDALNSVHGSLQHMAISRSEQPSDRVLTQIQTYDGTQKQKFEQSLATQVLTSAKPMEKHNSYTTLLGSADTTRDFEGVGGWRLTDDDPDDSLWIGPNSRLGLPSPQRPLSRHHQRSLSSQSQQYVRANRESFKFSPVPSTKATPAAIQSAFPAFGESFGSAMGYFDISKNTASSSIHKGVYRESE